MSENNLMTNAELKTIQENTISNIRYLLDESGYTQAKLAQMLGLQPNTISSYLSGSNRLPLEVVFNLMKIYNFTLDQFYFTNFKANDFKLVFYEKMNNYLGLYTLYYFNSVDDPDSRKSSRISYGLMYIYQSKNSMNHPIRAIAAMGLNYAELECYYNTFKDKCTIQDIESLENETAHSLIYRGNLEFIESAINVHLLHKSKDSAFYTLQNPKGSREYIGGLGLITSISRGNDVFGCSQYMACCKGLVTLHISELTKYLFIERNGEYLSEFDLGKVLQRLSQYYDPSQNELDEEEKRVLVKHNLNKVIENNMMKYSRRYIRVDKDLEYAWYQECKKYVPWRR